MTTIDHFLATIRNGDLKKASVLFHSLPPQVQPLARSIMAKARGEETQVSRFKRGMNGQNYVSTGGTGRGHGQSRLG